MSIAAGRSADITERVSGDPENRWDYSGQSRLQFDEELTRDNDPRRLCVEGVCRVFCLHAHMKQQLHRGMMGNRKRHMTLVGLKFFQETRLNHHGTLESIAKTHSYMYTLNVT